jgi:hypothetical protein
MGCDGCNAGLCKRAEKLVNSESRELKVVQDPAAGGGKKANTA